MGISTMRKPRIRMLWIACVLAAAPAFGDKPEWAGRGEGHGKRHADAREQTHPGRGGKHARKHDDERNARSQRGYFGDRHRTVVHDYYAEQLRAGRCPPGLAKKRNGCMPPGHAKKWRVGRALPKGTVFYAVPTDLADQLGPPPPRHRYVRVGGDVLLITLGTPVVVDVIPNLGRG